MTLDALLNRACRELSLSRLEARMLLAHAGGRSQEWVVAHGPDEADDATARRFLALADRRAGGEPIAYLVGRREFFSRGFAVTPAVLIPRPETELLVEAGLALLAQRQAPRILDLGTGSGVLAIILALERPDAEVVATDLSADALAVAAGNAAALGAGRIRFRAGDWWQALTPREGDFDLIVSNPPYIAEDDPHLAQGDLRFEPRSALSAGAGGDDAIRRLVAGAPARLAPGGWLAIEHGLEQGGLCRHLMAEKGFADVGTRRDLEGRERVTCGRTRICLPPSVSVF
jgi:release factor glutamine methyltransferase